jgi:YHS domain-containing protein
MKRFYSVVIIIVITTLLAACHSSNISSTPASSGNPAGAAKSPNGLDPVNKVEGQLAIKGYDAVAYFLESKAVAGSAEFSHDYLGARWYFSKVEYRDQFAREPQKYAPQYGGYCSWAVGHGYTANGDPNAWKIVDGKLYLNYNDAVQKRWEQDETTYIRQGDENWPRFLENKPEHKG